MYDEEEVMRAAKLLWHALMDDYPPVLDAVDELKPKNFGLVLKQIAGLPDAPRL